jgi:hypothetical protein
MSMLKGDAVEKDKKIRKLYHLDQEEVLFVREYARNNKMSESAVIRLAVQLLEDDCAEDPFAKLIGSVKAGPGQAAKHDEVIYE